MKLNEITKLSQFMEILDWDLDGHGLVIIDILDLQEAVLRTFPELEDDMTTDEEK